MSHWIGNIKEIGNPHVLTPEMTGDYELEDVRKHWGLEEPDIEWFNVLRTKDDNTTPKTQEQTVQNG